ncbi:MAG TPA: Hsp70 family protein [Thermodesulfobacteriota bacterium]|nr:Hsp70 family protein [Thermodesulfobacteriota bacterium]
MTENKSRFLIGIDLGTTNSAVAFIDTQVGTRKSEIQLLPIPQIVYPERVESKTILPSFLYLPGPYDLPREQLVLPWNSNPDRVAGIFAREHGSLVPGRLVSSAKSWLCHGGVDRTARILPWGAPAEVEKISPVDASAAYLRHMRDAWNHAQQEKGEKNWFEEQDIVLTVPASFDEVARELTLEAAQKAGLPHVTLLEEPLAAFYAWLRSHETDWSKLVQPQQVILVCDVGGGTTDFSLITLVTENEKLRFRRIAVGEHLLLGGDNIDATLARRIESRILGRPGKLDSARWHTLCHLCRAAKEEILSREDVSEKTIALMGRGTKLIGGTLQARLSRPEVEQVVLEDFFSVIDLNEASGEVSRRTGLSEWGLPYAADPCVTRHLARFLQSHAAETNTELARPDLILFNGGALIPRMIRDRIGTIVSRWFSSRDGLAWRPAVLENESLELAVARGAAYYGWVRRGFGIRVGAGMPRSYYIKVAPPSEATPSNEKTFSGLCVIERNMEEGETVTVERTFDAWANRPVAFDLYTSSVRMNDRAGEMYRLNEDQLHALPPVRTVLRFGKKTGATTVPVRLQAQLTEVGTLSLWCESRTTPHRWQLHFDLRKGHPSGEEEVVMEEETLSAAAELLSRTFTPPIRKDDDPESILKRLTELLGMKKERWPLQASRHLAEILISAKDGRRLGPQYEARWLNLTGFLLRPGFGHPLDGWKIKEVWKIFPQGLYAANDAQCKAEWWILWRRIAGGLETGHQLTIFDRLRPYVLRQASGKAGKGKLRVEPQELMEMWMAAASFERLPIEIKQELGDTLLASIKGKKAGKLELWCLSRLGARMPFYGPLNRVVPKEVVSVWIEKLLDLEVKNPQPVAAALSQMARLCNDRQRDLDERLIQRILDRLAQFEGKQRYQELLIHPTETAEDEKTEIFGESLPPGLVLREPDSGQDTQPL